MSFHNNSCVECGRYTTLSEVVRYEGHSLSIPYCDEHMQTAMDLANVVRKRIVERKAGKKESYGSGNTSQDEISTDTDLGGING